MADRIKIGLVGAGAIARAVHLPILTRRSDLFKVVAICDPNEASCSLATQRFGIDHSYRSVGELTDSGETTAVMATHSGSHSPTIISALEAGLQVFSEKPLAYTHAEIDAIEKAPGEQVMVGYMKPYDPAVEVAAEHLASMPEVRSIEVVVLHPTAGAQLATSELEPPAATPPSSIPPPEESHLLEQALGPAAAQLGEIYTGILLGSISHDLSVMRALGSSIDVVDHARYWAAGGDHKSVVMNGRSTANADVSIRWHFLSGYPEYREEVRFHTDTGSVELVFPAPYLLRAPTELRVTTPASAGATVAVTRSYEEAFERELLAFHGMVTEGQPPKDDIGSGRADVITTQKIARALAESMGIEIGGEAATPRK